MRWVRLLFRIFGWLLTPFLAWAASFFGAVGGALIAMRMQDPVQGLAVTALCGALTGFAALILWLRYLRQTPEAREVLAVTEDGTPDTVEPRDARQARVTRWPADRPRRAGSVCGSRPEAIGPTPPDSTVSRRVRPIRSRCPAPGCRDLVHPLAAGHARPTALRCLDRAIEIRRGGKRIPVPLLYTGEAPRIVNDSTARAILYTGCRAGDAYLVDLRNGRPTTGAQMRHRALALAVLLIVATPHRRAHRASSARSAGSTTTAGGHSIVSE